MLPSEETGETYTKPTGLDTMSLLILRPLRFLCGLVGVVGLDTVAAGGGGLSTGFREFRGSLLAISSYLGPAIGSSSSRQNMRDGVVGIIERRS